jgi:DNA-binding transcriptional MerR regulator
MRISELSERTGVPVATLKYYLRERLLHAGTPLGATRADYDESHVERVRLVRTLIDVGRLTIDRVGEVVRALEDPPDSRHDLLGVAHRVLRNPGEANGASDPLIDALGWRIAPNSVARGQLAAALERARRDGLEVSPETFATFAEAAELIAESDVRAELGEAPAAEALQYVILGNVLTDGVVIALRRLAQEHVSAQRFASPG